MANGGLITTTVTMNGYEKLKSAVERECNEKNECGFFNPNGCNVEGARIGTYGEEGYKSCFYKYCDTFKWGMDRAGHYSGKTGIKMFMPVAWEKK